MGNKSCYSKTHRRMRNNTTSNLLHTPQSPSSRRQYPIYHDKIPTQNQHRYEISSIDLEQKYLIDLFLVPYYNIEILSDDFNSEQECGICFEIFSKQDIVARLECLCIYHKKCLDEWGQRKRCCPLHMDRITLNNRNKFPSSTDLIQKEKAK